MASIFKPTGRNKYRITYKDGFGRPVTVPGYRDKAATQALARTLERDAERQRAGLPVAQQQRRMAPIQEAITAWRNELNRLGRDDHHIKDSHRYVTKTFQEMRCPNLASFRVDAFTMFLGTLTCSPRTQNAYQGAANSFMRFCVRQTWLEDNPLRNLPSTPRRKVRFRRAFSPDEFARLIATSKYATLYTVAAYSGFRRKELERLQKQHIQWWPSPQWNLPAAYRKSQRPFVQPIMDNIVPMLRDLCNRLAEPTSLLFPHVPPMTYFKRDLERAEIPFEDAAGKRVDFHALRNTYCTILNRAGLRIKTVQSLMDHTKITHTMDLYNDLGLKDMEDALTGITLNFPTPEAPPANLVPLALPHPENMQFSQGFVTIPT